MKKILGIIAIVSFSLLLLVIFLCPNQEEIIEAFFEKICLTEKEAYEKISQIQDKQMSSNQESKEIEEVLYQYYKTYITKDALESIMESGLLTIGLNQHQYNQSLEIESLDIKETVDDAFSSCYEYEIVWLLSDSRINGKGKIYFDDKELVKIAKILCMD